MLFYIWTPLFNFLLNVPVLLHVVLLFKLTLIIKFNSKQYIPLLIKVDKMPRAPASWIFCIDYHVSVKEFCVVPFSFCQ